MKDLKQSTGRQHAKTVVIPPETVSVLSVCGSATREARGLHDGFSGNPQKQSAESEESGSEWISSLLTSAGLLVSEDSVDSRAGLGRELSAQMLALTLARSQMRR